MYKIAVTSDYDVIRDSFVRGGTVAGASLNRSAGEQVSMSDGAPDGAAVSSSDGAEQPADAGGGPAPSDAFGALGGETRTTVLRTLFEAERDAGGPVRRSFSDLFEASAESTTAGFAYHLRQLTDTYLEKVPDGDTEQYRLTAAGRRVARAIAAGTLTDSADREPVDLADPCPFCGESALAASGDDTVLTVGCGACDREVLALPFPPGGYRTHDDDRLPAAVDRYYRGRIATLRDGVCPECGGEVTTAVTLDDDEDGHDHDDAAQPVARARMACRACGYRLRCPVALTLLEEPAVVAAFHDAGIDLADRPLWNVGDEWRERVVSTDPVAVRVTATVGGRDVACFVGRDLSVVHTDLTPADGDGDGRSTAVGSGPGADDVADHAPETTGSVSDAGAADAEETTEDREPGTATA